MALNVSLKSPFPGEIFFWKNFGKKSGGGSPLRGNFEGGGNFPFSQRPP